MKYELVVTFDNINGSVLYNGDSYLRSNLIDKLYVSENEIRLIFERKSKVNIENILFTPNSIIRYELQRALCFYLITQGTIPKVESVFVSDGRCKTDLEEYGFTEMWKNCNVDICIPVEKASMIFVNHKNAKSLYITITYMIKSQIDAFSNDCYRAAWTALNSIYKLFNTSQLGDERVTESTYIKKLDSFINSHKMKNSKERAKELSRDFFKGLEWYIFLKNTKKYDNILSMNHDKEIYECILNRLQDIYNEKCKRNTDIDVDEELIKKFQKKKSTIDYKARLRFLICQYCYMLRNRSFHGAKAYPVFIISEEYESKTEKILTELILKTCLDIIMESDLYN